MRNMMEKDSVSGLNPSPFSHLDGGHHVIADEVVVPDRARGGDHPEGRSARPADARPCLQPPLPLRPRAAAQDLQRPSRLRSSVGRDGSPG